jgi:periplasmic divalent cation tolerance protein
LDIFRAMPDTVLLVLTTCPDDGSAERLAESLVTCGLAACVNVGAPVTSIYPWEGRIERAAERLLFVKTTTAAYAALERELREQHPYELPEIIALPVTHGLPGYLEWVQECTQNA